MGPINPHFFAHPLEMAITMLVAFMLCVILESHNKLRLLEKKSSIIKSNMTKYIWKEFNQELLGFIKARVSNPENAEDILQEIFIKIHKNVNNIKDNKKIASWIYQIARNTIIDFYRKKKVDTKEIEMEEYLPKEIDDYTIDFTKCLKPFIFQLSEKDKDIILKIEFGNISQRDYSIKNNVSYSATKSRIQRARNQLKKMFINCCSVESDKYGNIISSNSENCDC